MRKSFKLKFVLMVAWVVLLTGCYHSTLRELSEEQKYVLAHPSEQNKEWVDFVAPMLIHWYQQQENILLQQGRQLTLDEIKIAGQMGVQNPEKIRILVTAEFPSPQDQVLATELEKLGFNSPNVGGLTIGYAILMMPKYEGVVWLLAHEFVHVAQREQMGSDAFLRQYLLELKAVGYRYSPLEIEADKLMSEYQ